MQLFNQVKYLRGNGNSQVQKRGQVFETDFFMLLLSPWPSRWLCEEFLLLDEAEPRAETSNIGDPVMVGDRGDIAKMLRQKYPLLQKIVSCYINGEGGDDLMEVILPDEVPDPDIAYKMDLIEWKLAGGREFTLVLEMVAALKLQTKPGEVEI
jgi:hypothetical protein